MIVTKELTKRFGSMVAVDDLSLSVSPGAVTGFLGPNGSGKSTTMRMILRLGTLIRHTPGAIAVFAGITLLAPILLHSIAGTARDAPEIIFANSVAAVVRQSDALSVTIGVVLMVASCAGALGLGAVLLDRRDA